VGEPARALAGIQTRDANDQQSTCFPTERNGAIASNWPSPMAESGFKASHTHGSSEQKNQKYFAKTQKQT
jgi:hypothetical protein